MTTAERERERKPVEGVENIDEGEKRDSLLD